MSTKVFLITWAITSTIAYIMLYITERKMPKGFTPFDAWWGFILCAIPYVFFLLFTVGLILSIKDRKSLTVKHPTITKSDMEKYQKEQRQIRNKQAV